MVKIFHNITAFAEFRIKKMQAWWAEENSLKNIQNPVQKLLTGSVRYVLLHLVDLDKNKTSGPTISCLFFI